MHATPVILVALLSVFVATLPLMAGEKDGEDEQASLVRLSEEQQRLAGIRTGHPRQVEMAPRRPVAAKVVDPLPLLDSAAHWQKLQQRQQAAKRLLAIAAGQWERLRRLGTSVRQAQLNEAESRWIAAKLKLEAATLDIGSLRHRMILTWGKELTRWIEDSDARLHLLGNGNGQLLRLVFPSPPSSACPDRFVIIQPPRESIPLTCLSAAPRIDDKLTGFPYFYLGMAPALPVGGRLTSWQMEPRPYVTVPARAILWEGGVPWIYVQSGDGFVRKALHDYRSASQLWWISREELTSDQRIVLDGAQILLSTELRGWVPEEEDDDD